MTILTILQEEIDVMGTEMENFSRFMESTREVDLNPRMKWVSLHNDPCRTVSVKQIQLESQEEEKIWGRENKQETTTNFSHTIKSIKKILPGILEEMALSRWAEVGESCHGGIRIWLTKCTKVGAVRGHGSHLKVLPVATSWNNLRNKVKLLGHTQSTN